MVMRAIPFSYHIASKTILILRVEEGIELDRAGSCNDVGATPCIARMLDCKSKGSVNRSRYGRAWSRLMREESGFGPNLRASLLQAMGCRTVLLILDS